MKFDSYNHSVGYKALIRHIILQAVLDLGSSKKRIVREAENFLKSEDCKFMCDCLDFDYYLIESINWDNPRESIDLDFRLKNLKTTTD